MSAGLTKGLSGLLVVRLKWYIDPSPSTESMDSWPAAPLTESVDFSLS